MYYFCQKYDVISKIKKDLLLKGIYSETKYVYVFTYQVLSF